MPAQGSRNLEKEKFWREIFRDWEESGLTVVEFCRSKRLAPAQFYKWKPRIRELDGANTAPLNGKRARMAVRAKAIAVRAKANAGRAVEFAEVKVIEHPKAQPPPSSKEHDIVLEIVFVSGIRFRVSKSCPPELLEATVALLECQ